MPNIKILIVAFLFWSGTLFAQEESQSLEITGRIFSSEDHQPLGGVIVFAPEFENGTISKRDGSFSLILPFQDSLELHFSLLGRNPKKIGLFPQRGEVIFQEILLDQRNLALKQIQVYAVGNKNKAGASIHISQEAILHQAAFSMGEILQLLPGGEPENPVLTQVNYPLLRSNATLETERKMESNGVQVLVDGLPLSNSSNLQLFQSSAFKDATFFESSVGGGVDLRLLSLDNLEKVEVIEGIPSSKYGEATSGMILLKTQRGRHPLKGRITFAPGSQKMAFNRGFSLGSEGASVNVDVNYLEGRKEVREAYPRFQTLGMQSRYSDSFLDDKLYLETTIAGSFSRDIDKPEKGSEEELWAREEGIRLGLNGELRLNKSWSRLFELKVHWESRSQSALERRLYSGSIKPLLESSSIGTRESVFLPSEYYSSTRIEGNPATLFLSASNSWIMEGNGCKHRFLVGGEYRNESNNGQGRFTESGYFPYPGLRPFSYRDFQGIEKWAFFLEDHFSTSLGGRPLEVQLGIREQYYQARDIENPDLGRCWLPRINFKWKLNKNVVFHGGYGMMAKAPSFSFIYPDPVWVDGVSYQNYSDLQPSENLLLVTSGTYSLQPSQLKATISRKWEGGISIGKEAYPFRITFFNESYKNIWTYEDQLVSMPIPVYDTYFYFPGLGEKPILDEVNVDTLHLRKAINRPSDKMRLIKKGLEFLYVTPKLGRIGTSFHLSGLYLKSFYRNDMKDVNEASQNWAGNEGKFMGIYAKNEVNRTRFQTRISAIQHIPLLRLVGSLTLHTKWLEVFEPVVHNKLPVGYFDTKGKRFPLSKNEARSEQWAFLTWKKDEGAEAKISKPPLWRFDFRLSKEVGEHCQFSLNVNNLIMGHPGYYNEYSGLVEKRNQELFFRSELLFKF